MARQQHIPRHLRQLAKQQLQEAVTTFVFDGTSVRQTEATMVRSTILEHKYGLQDVALLRARDKPEELDWDRWKAALEYCLGKGLEHEGKRYTIIGGSSSLKNGVYWLGTQEMKAKVHRCFRFSQQALSYFGILTSSCHHGIHDVEARIEVVDDGELDTADGMGWVRKGFIERLQKPHRQMQVRLVADDWLAKGTLHPMPDDPSFPDADIVLPRSMVKGARIPASGVHRLTIGIRDVAQKRAYASNFTLAQWFPQHTWEALYPLVDARLAVLKNALSSNEAALDFLSLLPGDDDPESKTPAESRTKLEAFLKAGLSPTHPWINRHLRELMRRQYVTLALGGGIELTGYMGAYADLETDHVCIPDLPEGPVVISRYPIRDPHSLQAVWNKPDAVPCALEGTIYLPEDLAKDVDGDFDGDYYIVCSQQPVIEAVWSGNWGNGYQRLPEQAKRRRNDPLDVLPYVAVESMGNAIGYLTYLITASVLEGKPEYVPALSASLQNEVQSLKWSTKADMELLRQVETEITIPDWLAGTKNNKEVFARKAEPVDGNHPLIDNYNRVVRSWQAANPTTAPLIHFKPQIPLWVDAGSLDCVEEAGAVLSLYNRWIGCIIQEHAGEPTTEDLQAPVSFLEAWAQTKDDKHAWAVALWNVVHGTRSDNSGSAVFHAFPEETVELLRRKHERMPVLLPKSRPSSAVKPDTWVIPVVGGRFYDKHDKNDAMTLRGGKLNCVDCDIRTSQADDDVVFVCDESVLGVLPKDHLLYGAIPAGLSFKAKLVFRGRTIWLSTDRLF